MAVTATQAAMPQHLCALQRANAVRMRRAEIKRQLKVGEITLQDALADSAVASMDIGDLLRCVPRWGKTRVMAALAQEHISPTRTVQRLTPRQRDALIEAATR